jgi:hypothetical protein
VEAAERDAISLLLGALHPCVDVDLVGIPTADEKI